MLTFYLIETNGVRVSFTKYEREYTRVHERRFFQTQIITIIH